MAPVETKSQIESARPARGAITEPFIKQDLKVILFGLNNVLID